MLLQCLDVIVDEVPTAQQTHVSKGNDAARDEARTHVSRTFFAILFAPVISPMHFADPQRQLNGWSMNHSVEKYANVMTYSRISSISSLNTARTHRPLVQILERTHAPLPTRRYLERDVRIARMVHVEQVRVEFDMADVSRVLSGRDGRVGEDLHGGVGFRARKSVGDGTDDLVGGEGLREET